MPKDIPVVVVEKIGSMGPLGKGQEVGIEMQLEGSPMLTLAFRTILLGAAMPFISEAIARANKEAGAAAETAWFVAQEASVSWNDDGGPIELPFQL